MYLAQNFEGSILFISSWLIFIVMNISLLENVIEKIQKEIAERPPL